MGAKRLILVASAAAALAVTVALPAAAGAAVCDSNLMIVLDRSCSMQDPPGGGVMTPKWDLAAQAIQALTTQYALQLRFGLIMFPDQTGVNCEQDGPIYVNVGLGNEMAVNDTITGTNPTGPCVTNIDTAMGQVAADPVFGPVADPSGRRSFVLLITDGEQSGGACGGPARNPVTEANIAALYANNYPTYVVGFGGQVDPVALAAFATAGGVPRAGMPVYYQADNAADLTMALDAIAGDIVGDPELGGCAGTPCPDGRCFGTYETCTDGVCVVNLPDAGPGGGDDGGMGNGDGGNGDGGNGGNGDGDASGCGCRVGRAATNGARGATTAFAAFATFVAGALLLAFRRRRR